MTDRPRAAGSTSHLDRINPAHPQIRRSRQLLLALVMAAADPQTLLFSGIVDNARLSSPPGLGIAEIALLFGLRVALTPSLWCGLVMMLAVWGLLRLRTWALSSSLHIITVHHRRVS